MGEEEALKRRTHTRTYIHACMVCCKCIAGTAHTANMPLCKQGLKKTASALHASFANANKFSFCYGDCCFVVVMYFFSCICICIAACHTAHIHFCNALCALICTSMCWRGVAWQDAPVTVHSCVEMKCEEVHEYCMNMRHIHTGILVAAG